jgi:NAD(P)-dependent dehydrogenase (short-subunit alcohol dehydrogenase family)
MKRVLITGAASGLGRALALAWARRGARIVVADLHRERGTESMAMCLHAGAAEAHFLNLDVTLEDDFRDAHLWVTQHWDGLDILVNNAGVAGGGSFESITDADWLWMLNINLLGVVRGCRVFTPLFKQQKHGQFVNIASMAGLLNPPSMANYNVAKAGVVALSETLDSELCPWNIRTLAVAPSYFQTNLNESLRTNDATMASVLPKLLSNSDITADDIAEGIVSAVEQGLSLYLPHDIAKTSWKMKRTDPEKHTAIMRAQAMKIASRRDK